MSRVQVRIWDTRWTRKQEEKRVPTGNLELGSKQYLTVLRHVVNPRSENSLVRAGTPELETELKNRKLPLITTSSHALLIN